MPHLIWLVISVIKFFLIKMVRLLGVIFQYFHHFSETTKNTRQMK
jgi:hypothetical protein